MFRVFISNWRTLEDPISPPVTSWFGWRERLLAVDRSDGWEYAADNPTAFFGDIERIKPLADSVEYLTWQFADLHHFVFTVYAPAGSPVTNITVFVSTDGQTWSEAPFTVTSQEQAEGAWSKYLLAGIVPAHITAEFVKFQVQADVDDGNVPELGNVLLYSLND